MDEVSKSQITTSRERSLANLKPWPKGISGNPAGRPKRTPITAIYDEIFDNPEMREAIKQQAFKTMAAKGMAGVLERREAAERIEGKVALRVEGDMHLSLTLEQVLEAKERAAR